MLNAANAVPQSATSIGVFFASQTGNGEAIARQLAQEILAGQLLVETEDHRRVLIEADEVLTVLKRGGNRASKKKSDA